MITMWRSKIPASAAAIVLILASSDSVAGGSCLNNMAAGLPQSEVNSALANFGARVIAVGRVDAVAPEFGVEVLGIRVAQSALDSFQIGDYALVIDWSKPGTVERLLEVRPLSSRYVPGLSEVFLRSKVIGNDVLHARVRLGEIGVDYSNSVFLMDRSGAVTGSTMAIRGIQPQPSGIVLGSCISILRDGSLGTGKPGGSLGTGWMDGSLGTGRPEGSLGTGKPDGSLGTGRADGSLGTGRPEGSLGTGKPDGSLGTGRPDGSLGTGWVDGSLGTGRPEGSLGTGKPDGSLGTGRPDGSLGTGWMDGSLGTGRPEGSLGTGKPDGSLGTGRADGSLGTGRPEGSLGTGKPDGSLGRYRPRRWFFGNRAS